MKKRKKLLKTLLLKKRNKTSWRTGKLLKLGKDTTAEVSELLSFKSL
jgi:hypothetical protein